MEVLGSSAFHGVVFAGSQLGPFDLMGHYGDGAGTFLYLGSSPWGQFDALGLSIIGVDDVIMWGVGGVRGGVEELISQYGENLLADVEWATDWDMGDDWHTRSDNDWMADAYRTGFWRGLIDEIRDTFMIEEIEWLLGGKCKAGKVVSAAKFTGKAATSWLDLKKAKIPHYDNYADAKAARIADGFTGTEVHSHHGVEQQMTGRWRTKVRPGGGPCVNLERHFHLSDVRIRFNEAYKNFGGPKNVTLEQAKKIIKYVYSGGKRGSGATTLMNESLKYIRGH